MKLITQLTSQVKTLLGEKQELAWVRDLSTQPRLFAQWLEGDYPKLAKRLLGGASNLIDPFVAGMGLVVVDYGDQVVSVRLPYRWKNRSHDGEMPLSVVASAAEYSLRLFWDRHLDPMRSKLHVKGLEAHLSEPVLGTIEARYEIDALERERILFELNSQGHYKGNADIPLFNSDDQRVGLMEYRIDIIGGKVLEAKS